MQASFPGGICYLDEKVLKDFKDKLTKLPSKYAQLAEEIRNQLRTSGEPVQPLVSGPIFLTEYPDPTRSALGDFCGRQSHKLLGLIGYQSAKWASLNVLFELNRAVRAAASAIPGGVYVGGIADQFRTHGECAGEQRWFNTINDSYALQGPLPGINPLVDQVKLANNIVSKGGVHPNEKGHQIYANALWEQFASFAGIKYTPAPVGPLSPQAQQAAAQAQASAALAEALRLKAEAASRLSNGDVIKGSTPAIYLVQRGQLRWIPNMETFNAWGFKGENIRLWPDAAIAAMPKGADLPPMPDIAAEPGLPIYRLYQPQNDWHLYTDNAAERPAEWRREGVAFELFQSGTPLTVPLWQLARSDGGYFYGVSGPEFDAVWSRGGDAKPLGNIALTQGLNTVPLYRFYKANGRHFYTISKFEGDQAGLRSEGVIGFVKPPAGWQPPAPPPIHPGVTQPPAPQQSEPKVSLKSTTGHFVVAEGGGGGIVRANRTQIGPWETFTLIDTNGGPLMHGDAVHLRAGNGQYIVAEGGGGRDVNANRPEAREWETFVIEKIGGGDPVIQNGARVALKTGNGRFYVVAEGGGNGAVNANRTVAGPWETFQIVVHGAPPGTTATEKARK
jgi:hypothetical protein